MQIISGTTEFNIPEKTVVTIGKFDGLHNGHVVILDRMKEYINRGYKRCVMTFDMPPSTLGFGTASKVLMTTEEKEFVFAENEIDYLIEFPFYEKTASIRAREFIEEYVVDRMNAKAVIVGDDCSFGYQAEGDARMLRDFGPTYEYEVEVLNKLKDGKRDISSTYLRELVSEGRMLKVRELSYRPYFVHGRFSRQEYMAGVGVPQYYTEVPSEKALPKSGVYYTKIIFEDAYYPALTYVPEDRNILETYMYGSVRGIDRAVVSIAFLDRMRDHIEFKKGFDVKNQIKQDIIIGHKWHKENP